MLLRFWTGLRLSLDDLISIFPFRPPFATLLSCPSPTHSPSLPPLNSKYLCPHLDLSLALFAPKLTLSLSRFFFSGQLKKPTNAKEFNERAIQILPAEIRMLSGCRLSFFCAMLACIQDQREVDSKTVGACRDEQTSADVSNTASFGLPPDSGPGGAGGACTNAMMKSLSKSIWFTQGEQAARNVIAVCALCIQVGTQRQHGSGCWTTCGSSWRRRGSRRSPSCRRVAKCC